MNLLRFQKILPVCLQLCAAEITGKGEEQHLQWVDEHIQEDGGLGDTRGCD